MCLKKLFVTPINLQYLKHLEHNLETNRNLRALLGKHCVTNKSKLLPTLRSCTHVDEQIALLKIYKNISKSNLTKHKPLGSYTKFMISFNGDNFKKKALELCLDMNTTNDSVFGYKLSVLNIDSLRMKCESIIFFNKNDIKIYTDKIYYINYVSVSICTIEDNKLRLIAKSMIFEMQTSHKNGFDLIRIETKCNAHEIKFLNLCGNNSNNQPEPNSGHKPKIEELETINKQNKSSLKLIKCKKDYTTRVNNNTDTNNEQKYRDDKVKREIGECKVENKAPKHFNFSRTPKNATSDLSNVLKYDMNECTKYETPGSKNKEHKSEESLQDLHNVNLSKNITLRVGLNRKHDIKQCHSPNTTYKKSLELPWAKKHNSNERNPKCNMTSGMLDVTTSLSDDACLFDKSHSMTNLINSQKQKDNRTTVHTTLSTNKSSEKSKTFSFSFGFKIDNDNDLSDPQKNIKPKKVKQVKLIKLPRKKHTKYTDEIQRILNLKAQIFDELKSIYLDEEGRKLKTIIACFKKERKKLKGVFINKRL